jgi:hypothetical protein
MHPRALREEYIMTDPVAAHRASEADYVSDPSVNAALNKISWGAVFAGMVLALAVQFLLNLLGVGIGAAVIDPATTDNPDPSTFSIAGGLWFVVSGIVAAFVGGYVASRVSGRPSKATGSYHGLTSWAVTTLVVLYLLTTSVGTLVGGAFSGLSSIIGGVGKTAATVTTAAAPAVATSVDPIADIERQVRNATGGNDPAALRDAAVAAVRAATKRPRKKPEIAPLTPLRRRRIFRLIRRAPKFNNTRKAIKPRWSAPNSRRPKPPTRLPPSFRVERFLALSR